MSNDSSQTLLALVSNIQICSFKSKDISQDIRQKEKPIRKKWNAQQEHLFFDLIRKYGSDFSIIQIHFPGKTRKQIKKRYQRISLAQQKNEKKIERAIRRQRRKSTFDQEILSEKYSQEE